MYTFIDDDSTDTICIKLEDGEFKGTVFRFLNIKAKEDTDAGEGLIDYSFEIVKGNQELRENEDFHKAMSTVLHELIIEKIDKHLSEDN